MPHSTMSDLRPSLSLQSSIRITPKQYRKILRLLHGRAISEPMIKEDWLVLAAVFKSGFERPFDISRLKQRLLQWIRNHTEIFNEWWPDIRAIHPHFLDMLLVAGPRRPCPRRTARPSFFRPADRRREQLPTAHSRPTTSNMETLAFQSVVLPSLTALDGEPTTHTFSGAQRPPVFDNPLPMEPEIYTKPEPKNPLKSNDIETVNVSPPATYLLSQARSKFPTSRLLPEPQLPLPPPPISVPILQPPTPAQRRRATLPGEPCRAVLKGLHRRATSEGSVTRVKDCHAGRVEFGRRPVMTLSHVLNGERCLP
ncbi:hypothetical protein VTK73DRAFT_1013 [Phialemonium thermophilum]|uniref:Uncharacterized protein n=1 Tax=Phialemonium thermophilum TaxID=223376 RepID=A0ABR3XBT2_9PEZI